MPVLCDFVVIQGDANRRIGDGAILWEKTFNTGGRRSGGQAILMLMVKGLTYATEPVDVKINNKSVGKIFPYRLPTNAERNATADHWHTQIINIGGGILNSRNNELQMVAVGFPESTPSNVFDDFFVRDVVCFFQQSS